MRIAFIVGNVKTISGGSNVIFEYANGLAELGHDVVVFSQLELRPEDVSWHQKATQVSIDYLYSMTEWNREEFDFVFSTWWPTNFRAPRIRSKHYIYLNQSVESRFHKEDNLKIANKMTYLINALYLTESRWIQSFIVNSFGVPESNVWYIQNRLNLDFFPPVQKRPSRVKEKCLRVLIEGPWSVSFKCVPETFTVINQSAPIDNVEFGWLTSDSGGMKPSIWGKPVQVFAQIPFKDVHKIYRQHDVLIKLSTVEGMFGPPLEMFSQGGTAITNFVSGADEYVVDGWNSFQLRCVEYNQIGQILLKLRDSDKVLFYLKENAMETAKKFYNWNISVKALESKLEDTLRNSGDSCARPNMLAISYLGERYLERADQALPASLAKTTCLEFIKAKLRGSSRIRRAWQIVPYRARQRIKCIIGKVIS